MSEVVTLSKNKQLKSEKVISNSKSMKNEAGLAG